MSFPSKNLQLATPEDAPGMLDLLENDPSQGRISLLYTRRPNPLISYMREGDDVIVVVLKNPDPGRIDGMAACAMNTLYLAGKPSKIAYLFGFRIRREALPRIALMPGGYKTFLEMMEARGVQCAYTTILDENLPARRMLEKRRSSMPVYDYAGNFEVYTIVPGGTGRLPSGYRFFRAGPEDETRLLEFIHHEGGRHPFFPYVTKDDLTTGRTTPLLKDFYLLENKNGEIVSAGAVWDQRDYKQYVVNRYRGPYRWLYPISPAFRLFGYPRLSNPGTILPLFTLSCFAAKNDDPEHFGYFLRGIRRAGGAYRYFVVGLHERHPLREAVVKRPHILYRSRLYLVYDSEHGQRCIAPGDVPYVECGRL